MKSNTAPGIGPGNEGSREAALTEINNAAQEVLRELHGLAGIAAEIDRASMLSAIKAADIAKNDIELAKKNAIAEIDRRIAALPQQSWGADSPGLYRPPDWEPGDPKFTR